VNKPSCFLSEWPTIDHSPEECNVPYRLMDEKYHMKKLINERG
jgi:hypothetical protein